MPESLLLNNILDARLTRLVWHINENVQASFCYEIKSVQKRYLCNIFPHFSECPHCTIEAAAVLSLSPPLVRKIQESYKFGSTLNFFQFQYSIFGSFLLFILFCFYIFWKGWVCANNDPLPETHLKCGEMEKNACFCHNR